MLKSETYHGSRITFKRVPVDYSYTKVSVINAVKYFVNGRPIAIASTKAIALKQAKKKIDSGKK